MNTEPNEIQPSQSPTENDDRDKLTDELKAIVQQKEQSPTPEQTPSLIVFGGGVGYDEPRNTVNGEYLLGLDPNYYNGVLTVPGGGANDGTIVLIELRDGRLYPDGERDKLSGKESLKQLGKNFAEVRFSELDEHRAEQLIALIEHNGTQPVDAVFQSADASVGILAMWKRPELFKNVVLVDPSSIIDLPWIGQLLKEEGANGNLKKLRQFHLKKLRQSLLKKLTRSLKQKNDTLEGTSFEEPVRHLSKSKRLTRTGANGMLASLVSSLAPMLHEIAKSENAPKISIIASQFDHAYSPLRILQSLVNLNDIRSFFVTNSPHGIGGRKSRMKQVLEALRQTEDSPEFPDRLHFFDGVSDDYRKQVAESISERLQEQQIAESP